MARVYNFSAGPSILPEPALKKAASELLEYGTAGQSVMEMSHRSKEYSAIIEDCEKLLREVMAIPDNYKVLFIQGGATQQFSMVPLNLMTKSGKADYIVSGMFSKKAYQEGARFGDAKVVATSEADNYSRIPDLNPAQFPADADYLHICQNNTIFGTRYVELPQSGSVPLVSDVSSFILSEPLDVSKFGILYAGTQKNMGPAGMAVVIIREDLIGEPMENTPVLLQYKTYANNQSMYNTPPTYTIYMVKLVLEWIKNDMGGLEKMKAHNEKKCGILYNYLDQSKLFKGVADPSCRSLMNVTFVTGDKELDAQFCAEAQAAGFYNIKGHRSVGGMRASIYNAMPIEGLEKLVEFMKKFEAAH